MTGIFVWSTFILDSFLGPCSPSKMRSSDILTYTNRLILGENPIEVFTEIEIFYLIRQALNKLDPGGCAHGGDEYDSEAHCLLNYIISACENSKEVTNDEFTDFANEYFAKQFGELRIQDNKDFGYFLLQELKTTWFPSETVRGKN